MEKIKSLTIISLFISLGITVEAADGGRVVVLYNGDTVSDYVLDYAQWMPDGKHLGINIVNFDRHTWEYYFEITKLNNDEFDHFLQALDDDYGGDYQVE